MADRSRRLLPPMGALHSFAVAARLSSFSRAGEELGLTQSAVSRQIALLEDWLQLRLFDRPGRGVALTRDGRDYLDAVAPSLDRIRRATARALARNPDTELAIATLPSFGMRWLAPRLPGLTALVPDIVISIAARPTRFDFADEPFDAAIHFGNPDWPDVQHDFLFREEAVAVMSADFALKNRVTTPSDLLRLPLLTLDSRPDAWLTWFRDAGIHDAITTANTTFEQFLMLAQAAIAGAGAALIPKFLIEPELSAGTLISPFTPTATGSGAYYLVYPPEAAEGATFSAFRGWLLRECAAAG